MPLPAIVVGTVAVIRFILYLAGLYQLYQTYQELIDVIPGSQPGENGEDNGWKEKYFDPIPAAITGGFGIIAATKTVHNPYLSCSL